MADLFYLVDFKGVFLNYQSRECYNTDLVD